MLTLLILKMEQIFANPGFVHIAEKIIAYLDPISMCNFKQVNQIIANHFQSVKTCQLFFEKTLKKTNLDALLDISYVCHRIQHPTPIPPKNISFWICESFIIGNDLGISEKNEVDSDLMKNVHQEQIVQTQNLWKMYKMIMLFRFPFLRRRTKDSYEAIAASMISSIINAYKSLGECPLILAIETFQTSLAILMIENEMLEICHCIDQKSMLKYVNNFHPELAKYFTKQE